MQTKENKNAENYINGAMKMTHFWTCCLSEKKKSIWTGPKHWLNNLKNIFFLLGAKLKRCQHQIMATKIVMIRAELYGGKNMKWFDYHWSWHQTQIARSYVKCYQPVLRPYELFIQSDIFIFMCKLFFLSPYWLIDSITETKSIRTARKKGFKIVTLLK